MANFLSFMTNLLPFMGMGMAALGEGGIGQMGFGIAIAAASVVILPMFQKHLLGPCIHYLERRFGKLVSSVNPYGQIKFTEDSLSGGPKNYESYAAIETYLSNRCSAQAPRLMANFVRDIKTPILCVDGDEEVPDKFKGITVSWRLGKEEDSSGGDGYHGSKKNRYYVLTFRKRNREVVEGEYLRYVMEEGKAVAAMDRPLKLYSNSSSELGGGACWNYVKDFDHPAKFETLAMDEEKKKDIVDDLTSFSNGKDYYKRIGKAWKRGYLLYGPPGTGKTTMIAAVANLLHYDVYYLELTSVVSNASLKQLINRIPSNSILVIEDIDCASEITNQREKNKQGGGDNIDKPKKPIEKVTLSGLLNCLDGLFSVNDGGRVMMFTTNHMDALDSALVRTGRMDRHIEMSYCGFEAFKVLAKNYLKIDEDESFGKVEGLLKETSITPADVADILIRGNEGEDGGGKDCFNNLIKVLLEKRAKQNGECHPPENLIRRNEVGDCSHGLRL